MIVLEKEQLRPFDIDDCLVMHDIGDGNDVVEIKNPYSNETLILRPNRNMIRLLKEEYTRGGTIIVWSRGGHKWVTAVVYALGLEHYISLALSKPLVYFDDTPVANWLKDQVFIGPDTKYKQTVNQKKEANFGL